MLVEMPDHYIANLGGAMVERAASVIERTGIVPGYLYQFADLWDKGVKYGVGGDFWFAVQHHAKRNEKVLSILRDNHLI